MDLFVWVLFLILGAAVGSGGTAYILRNQKKQDTEQAKNGYETEINNLNEQIRDLKAKMESVRDEGKRYWEELQTEKKEREQAQDRVTVIPGLEKDLKDRENTLQQLKGDNEALRQNIDELELALQREREAFQNSLIYVQGSHYLPATVVRNLIRLNEDSEAATD